MRAVDLVLAIGGQTLAVVIELVNDCIRDNNLVCSRYAGGVCSDQTYVILSSVAVKERVLDKDCCFSLMSVLKNCVSQYTTQDMTLQ